MSMKFFCDRCGSMKSERDEIFSFSYPIWAQLNESLEELPRKIIDICAPCIRSLNDWTKPLPEHGNNHGPNV